MGNRYWITGVQVGMLKNWAKLFEHPDYADDILAQIENNQFIGNIGIGESKKIVLKNDK